VAAVGASGGGMIPAGTIEVFINHFVKNMDPLASVMAPRVYHQVWYLHKNSDPSILGVTLRLGDMSRTG
jgi:gamma-glutamyltranspeptidase